MARKATGIRKRHSKACRAHVGGGCNCKAGYEAWVFSRRDGGKIRKTFANIDEAKSWRHDALVALRKGTMRPSTTVTLDQAASAWLDGAREGSIRTRSGDHYKPSAIRSYERSLRLRVLPVLGAARLSDIRSVDLQDLADRLVTDGHSASTVQCAFIPLRAIFRREVARGRIGVNPTSGLELPAVRGGRDRIASPEEASKLIGALSEADRALWATAMYAGLRRGELMALRWEDVDLKAGLIHVRRSWDDKEGVIEPKSTKGRRKVPIADVLRRFLVEHRMRHGRSEGLVFGRTTSLPFSPTAVTKRVDGQWRAMKRITLHESRHTFASLMIAAGVNAKALSTYMGHANISITLDRYGHLMPGNEEEAAGLLDAYLAGRGQQAMRPEGAHERL